jgi:hypothetical protein
MNRLVDSDSVLIESSIKSFYLPLFPFSSLFPPVAINEERKTFGHF